MYHLKTISTINLFIIRLKRKLKVKYSNIMIVLLGKKKVKLEVLGFVIVNVSDFFSFFHFA